jgi:hypothetical protein
MNIFSLKTLLPKDIYNNLHDWLETIEWYEKIPGGFVTNSPKRQVAAFGTGGAIDDDGKILDNGWVSAFWTAKINQNNVSLETPTIAMPDALCGLIPTCRWIFKLLHPDAELTNNTFTIAVCNYYSDPDMNIAAHTDANPWYPIEDETVGPVFASLTFYPEGPPDKDEHFARFQIKKKGKWTPLKLPDDSLMIMASNIEHRVLSHTKKQRPYFKPRINITLRSTFPITKNPLMNAMATSNHSRYYRPPSRIFYPNDIDSSSIREIINYYQIFLSNYNKKLELVKLDQTASIRSINKKTKHNRYSKLITRLNLLEYRVSPNITSEILEMVCNYLESNYDN